METCGGECVHRLALSATSQLRSLLYREAYKDAEKTRTVTATQVTLVCWNGMTKACITPPLRSLITVKPVLFTSHGFIISAVHVVFDVTLNKRTGEG